MSKITFARVSETLREVVAEKPDYEYEGPLGGEYCAYTDADGTPSCIVGQVIFRLDPDALKEIHDHEWNQDGEFITSPAAHALDWATRNFTHAERKALRAAQYVQDQGGTWAKALEEFEQEVRYIK